MKTGPDASSGPGDASPGNTALLSSKPPIKIPNHELLRCIGDGSYGEVWLARDLIGNFRAVKIVYRSSFKDEHPFEREVSGIRKFEPVSRSHDGFVDILHVGIDEAYGCLYYVMELGDDQFSGREIVPEHYVPKTVSSEILNRGALPLHETIQLGLLLGQALTELHERGLVHRDIKPSNIIFVDGKPKLADVGLVAEAKAALSFVGTAGFIPPEGPGTVQADIYSLGKVLYEASTGKDRQEFPSVPTLWEASPDHGGLLELNEVIVRACRTSPEDRYASAWEMQGDLAAIANGKSVRRLRLLEKRWQNVKKGLAISAGILAILGIVLYELDRGWRAADNLRRQEIGANSAYGKRAMESGDLLGALPYYAEVLRLAGNDSAAQTMHRLRLGSLLDQCPKLTHVWLRPNHLNTGQFSPDGKHVLLAELFGGLCAFDLEARRPLPSFGEIPELTSAAYSPDGRLIVTASQNDSASIWDLPSRSEKHRIAHPDRVFYACFSPDGQQVLTCCKDGVARLCNVDTGELVHELKGHTAAVNFGTFSHDGKRLITCGQDGIARLWDARDGQPFGRLMYHGQWVTGAAFSCDDARVITTSTDRRACAWDAATQNRIRPDLKHNDGVRSVEFSPDGKMVATASLDGTVRLWLAETLEPLPVNPVLTHPERVTWASFSPDARRLLTCCADGSARIWDLAGAATPPARMRRFYSSHGARYLDSNDRMVHDAATAVALSPALETVSPNDFFGATGDGRLAFCISAGTDGSGSNRVLRLWDTTTGKEMAPLRLPGDYNQACVDNDGRLLATYGGNSAQVLDLKQRTAASPRLQHDTPITVASLTTDGKKLLTVSGNTVQLWSTATGKSLIAPLVHPSEVPSAQFSPDGALLATCFKDVVFTKCWAQVWSCNTGQPVGPRLRHNDGVTCLAFSPDGSRIATGGEDFTAMLWETKTGRAIGAPLQHAGQVLSVSFSPDGQLLVTAAEDRMARVWSASTGDPVIPPLRHLVRIRRACFVPGTQRIATTDYTGTFVCVWDLKFEQAPLERLLELPRLLSGHVVSETSRVAEIPVDALWNRLQASWQDRFAVTPQHAAAWHDYQAQESELQGRWSSAAFHLKQLLALMPNEAGTTKRLADARQKAAGGE